MLENAAGFFKTATFVMLTALIVWSWNTDVPKTGIKNKFVFIADRNKSEKGTKPEPTSTTDESSGPRRKKKKNKWPKERGIWSVFLLSPFLVYFLAGFT